MVSFAELKAKAEKAKEASVTKVTNTRDRLSSAPSSKITWDPNWKRGPPPPSVSTPPPAVSRASRPSGEVSAPPPYTPPPLPTRAPSGYSAREQETPQDAVDGIDWANLSPEDKEEFFGWLDEFFSRHLGIELSPRERRSAPSTVVATPPVYRRPPPTVNMTTRPRV